MEAYSIYKGIDSAECAVRTQNSIKLPKKWPQDIYQNEKWETKDVVFLKDLLRKGIN